MFAMFSDIYRFSSKETIDSVDKYCIETGADWAMTFYDPEQLAKYEALIKAKEGNE